MKIGIIGSLDYPNLKLVQDYINYLAYIYRPFGNMNDEWEEPITILNKVSNNLDCTAIIQAAKVNFKMKLLKTNEDIINKADKVIIFRNGECIETLAAINYCLIARKNLEIIHDKHV